MCDCYTGLCGGCGCEVEVHIGDYSTNRGSVLVWCPDCHESFTHYLEGRCIEHSWLCPERSYFLFTHLVPEANGRKAGYKKGLHLFLVTIPHGITVNT